MGFYLPGIYKPFYIEGLLVHSQRREEVSIETNETLFALIDVHNGIGIYDKDKCLYYVGDVSCEFNFGKVDLPSNNTISVYREKPLFASSYQDSISSIFYKVDVTGEDKDSPSLIKVSYESPIIYDYDITVNRDISIEFYVDTDSGIYYKDEYGKEPFSLSNYDAINKWEIKSVNPRFVNFVYGATSNNVAYYVVNEAFYKYFIKPETYIHEETSLFYRTYNNGENKAFQGNDGDRIRNFCDLFPYKIRYDGDNTTNNFDFDKEKYDTNTENCCYTKPFLRMFPALNNNLSNNPNTEQPGCCRIVYDDIYNSIKFEGGRYIISNIDKTNPNFYLICVKSPLTNNRILGTQDDYESAINKGSYLNPEQDYITYIRNYGRIELEQKI